MIGRVYVYKGEIFIACETFGQCLCCIARLLIGELWIVMHLCSIWIPA